MYAHTTWPPPGAPTGAPTGAPHRAGAVHRAPRCSATARPDADASNRSPHRPDADASNRSPLRADGGTSNRAPRCSATAPGSLGRWGR
ncbi:hypothetical protein ACFQ64_29670 [Streptomyces sp. NPDC056460]|uniref:hypothetical protein n=1 Tax=Streptomyces sp. NPDC056460 TaxID=3345825 RepID=UPI0036826779